MRLRVRIFNSATFVARALVVLAALVVALDIHPIHAHVILDSAGDSHLGHNCASHGDASGGAGYLPTAQGDCAHYFHPLFRLTSLSLFTSFQRAGPTRDSEWSPQIFHGFDPPPPRLFS